MTQTDDLTIFITGRESVCEDCGDALGGDAWIMLTEDKRALCLACADLEHLLFLPAGDAALTRRSRKYSRLSGRGSQMEPPAQTVRAAGVAGRGRGAGAEVFAGGNSYRINCSTKER